MPKITPDILVIAVLEMAQNGPPLVSSQQINAWCGINEVDGGGPYGFHVWTAEIQEAQAQRRLLKFKENHNQTAPVYFSHLECAEAARTQAHENGWIELNWNEIDNRWDWK